MLLGAAIGLGPYVDGPASSPAPNYYIGQTVPFTVKGPRIVYITPTQRMHINLALYGGPLLAIVLVIFGMTGKRDN